MYRRRVNLLAVQKTPNLYSTGQICTFSNHTDNTKSYSLTRKYSFIIIATINFLLIQLFLHNNNTNYRICKLCKNKLNLKNFSSILFTLVKTDLNSFLLFNKRLKILFKLTIGQWFSNLFRSLSGPSNEKKVLLGPTLIEPNVKYFQLRDQ